MVQVEADSWKLTGDFLRSNGVSVTDTEQGPGFAGRFESETEVWLDGDKLILVGTYNPGQKQPGYQVELVRQPEVTKPMVLARFSLQAPREQLPGFLNRISYSRYQPNGQRVCAYIHSVAAIISPTLQSAALKFSIQPPEGITVQTKKVNFYLKTGRMVCTFNMAYNDPDAAFHWPGMRKNSQR